MILLDFFLYWSVGSVVEDTANVADGLGFDSRADQIKHSVANGSPPLQCFFGAILLRRWPRKLPRHSLHTSIMKICYGTNFFIRFN